MGNQINKPDTYFNTLLYTGDGATSTAGTTARTLTGVGFQPDLTWVKERSNTEQHFLQDAVRGASKVLASNTTSAEADVLTNYTDGGINGFVSDGFTLGSGTAGNANNINTNTETYVAWNWLASNTTASNNDGSITSTVSANTTSGFSIITYTGTGSTGTIGHGLNSAPELVILRNRDVSSSWWVWGELLGNVNIMELQSTSGKVNPNGNYHNDTMPTSSVISIGSDGTVSGSGQSHICYAFHSVKGYSKIGSYTGNGSADGTFVYTGFKPAFVIIKRTDSADWWGIFDNKREGYNETNDPLFANTSGAESTLAMDILSNGFKCRNTNGGVNASGGSYIYMAFADQPLTGTNGVPCTAR